MLVQGRSGARGAVTRQEIRHFGRVFHQRQFVQAVLGEAPVARRGRVRIGAARQQPFGEPDVALLHRRLEQKARAGSVPAHVEHRPVGILPGSSARDVSTVCL